MDMAKWEQDPNQYLAAELHKMLDGSTLTGDLVHCTGWDVTIRPEAAQVNPDNNMVVFYYHLQSPKWDIPLFECSVAAGSTLKKSIGLAQGGFLFGFLNGLGEMMDGEASYQVQSDFDGKSHSWAVYQSNIVGMGETPKDPNTRGYWTMLQDDIIKRLGNQRICYIKIYGAKNGDDITGECRINDIKSEALSQVVAEHLQSWETEGFGSQKQFFFLRQEDSTYTPYSHTMEQLAQHTRTAITMFAACDTQEQYEDFPAALVKAIGDPHLASELYSFLPEMCAENAYSSIDYGESFGIRRGESTVDFYKNQLFSYYPIQQALHSEFNKTINNDVYGRYVSLSSIWSVISKAREGGSNLEEGGKIALCFGFPEEYMPQIGRAHV